MGRATFHKVEVSRFGNKGDKLVVEIPHSRPARVYQTDVRMNGEVEFMETFMPFRDRLEAMSFHEVYYTLGQIKTRFYIGYPEGAQYDRVRDLVVKWARENLDERRARYVTEMN